MAETKKSTNSKNKATAPRSTAKKKDALEFGPGVDDGVRAEAQAAHDRKGKQE